MEYSLAIFVLCTSLCHQSVESIDNPPSLPSSGKKSHDSMIKLILFNISGARLYLPTGHVSLANFTMLAAGQFNYQDLDEAKDNITDALWCQSDAKMAENIGTWYRPPGANNQVPNTMTTPLWMVHYAGQVGLYRNSGIPGHEGQCVITDASMTEHTFFVGIYRTPSYNSYTVKADKERVLGDELRPESILMIF